MDRSFKEEYSKSTITELRQVLLYFFIYLCSHHLAVLIMQLNNLLVYLDKVNSKLICMTTCIAHTLLIDLQEPAMNSLTNSDRLSSIAERVRSITSIWRAKQTTTLELMNHYSFSGHFIIRPTFLSLKFHLFYLENLSEFPCQTTDTYINTTE